jgi:diguanylate cyclase (GGDEF)-like protein
LPDDQKLSAINQHEIERALTSRSISLRFPNQIEAEFELETACSRSRRLAIGGLIGLATYDLLSASDWWLTPDVFSTALLIRFGIVTPIELLSILVLWRGVRYAWRESIIALFGAILPIATHLYIMLSSSSPYRQAQQQAVVLVILFTVMVQQIRFLFAVPTCLVCLLLYACSVHRLADYPFELQLSSSTVLLSAITFSLFVSYNLEREMRRNFLLNVKNRLQNRALDTMSHEDALTGMQNRRSLDENLESICSHGGGTVSMVLADIDHFKKMNDAAGHRAGDVCLKSVASLLKEALTENGATAFRYGGEEFLVVLPGRDRHEARAIAERMRLSVENARIPHPGLPGAAFVTLSFGVAGGYAVKLADIEEIISGADAALYAAKRNGRNQVWPPIAKHNQPARRYS